MFTKDKKIFIFISMLLVRIPLSHIIGDNGLGYLSGPLELFWCFYLLLGYGITHTMAGMMRDRIRREQVKNAALIYSLAKKYVLISIFVVLILGSLLFNTLTVKILGDPGSKLAFISLGLAIALGVMVDLNIGFLSGTDNIKAAVLGELVDAVAVFAGVLVGGKFGYSYGIKIAKLLINDEVSAMYGAMGAMLGLCAGELIAFITLFIMNIIYQRTFKHLIRIDGSRRTEYVSDVSGKLISGILLDGLQAFVLQIPILILLTMFRKHGIYNGAEDTGAMIGAFYGKYLSIMGIISGFAVLCVNSSIKGIIVASNDSDDQLAGERISRLFGRVMYFCIPACIFVMMLGSSIVQTLFQGRTTTVISLYSVGSIVIVLYPLVFTFMAILVRLGYGREMLFVSALGLLISLIFGFIFVYKGSLELKGISIVLMIEYAFIALFCLFILFRNFRLRLRLLQQVLFPLIVAGIIGILIKFLAGVLFDSVGGILTLAICIIPGWLIYNLACMFLHVVSPGAMEHKLFGRILVRLGANIGIY